MSSLILECCLYKKLYKAIKSITPPFIFYGWQNHSLMESSDSHDSHMDRTGTLEQLSVIPEDFPFGSKGVWSRAKPPVGSVAEAATTSPWVDKDIHASRQRPPGHTQVWQCSAATTLSSDTGDCWVVLSEPRTCLYQVKTSPWKIWRSEFQMPKRLLRPDSANVQP